jgi:hypothetical protein
MILVPSKMDPLWNCRQSVHSVLGAFEDGARLLAVLLGRLACSKRAKMSFF